jgi:hypothetical protein
VLQNVFGLNLQLFTMCYGLDIFFHANLLMHIGTKNVLSASTIGVMLEQKLGTLRLIFTNLVVHDVNIQSVPFDLLPCLCYVWIQESAAVQSCGRHQCRHSSSFCVGDMFTQQQQLTQFLWVCVGASHFVSMGALGCLAVFDA